MIIEKQNVIQTLYLSNIHVGGMAKNVKIPIENLAFFNDAPLTGLFSVCAFLESFFNVNYKVENASTQTKMYIS